MISLKTEIELSALRNQVKRYQDWIMAVASKCGHSNIMSWPHQSTIENHIDHSESLLRKAGDSLGPMICGSVDKEQWQEAVDTLKGIDEFLRK